MTTVRDTRLIEDEKRLEKLTRRCSYLHIDQRKGNPPSEYLLSFSLKGYVNRSGSLRMQHKVRLFLPSGYPISDWPSFHFEESIWHPNVYPGGDVCLGFSSSSWKPGFLIDELVLDIAKIICFKKDSYRLASPANSDCSSSWIRSHTIPIDNTNLFPKDFIVTIQPKKPVIEIRIKDKAILHQPLKEKIRIKIKP